MSDVEAKVKKVAEALGFLVAEKGIRYGDAALNPLEIFSKPTDGPELRHINTRLDEKLSRIKVSSELRKNDVADLMGYLLLLCVHKEWMDFSEMID